MDDLASQALCAKGEGGRGLRATEVGSFHANIVYTEHIFHHTLLPPTSLSL